jgi:hypothetical protein
MPLFFAIHPRIAVPAFVGLLLSAHEGWSPDAAIHDRTFRMKHGFESK